MKKKLFILLFLSFFLLKNSSAVAQCSVCTKTAMQMGEKPAQGLNQGIIYLMMAPFAIVGVIGFRWWKLNKQVEAEEQAPQNS